MFFIFKNLDPDLYCKYESRKKAIEYGSCTDPSHGHVPGILVDGGNAGVLSGGAAAVSGGQGGAALLQVPGLQATLTEHDKISIRASGHPNRT